MSGCYLPAKRDYPHELGFTDRRNGVSIRRLGTPWRVQTRAAPDNNLKGNSFDECVEIECVPCLNYICSR